MDVQNLITRMRDGVIDMLNHGVNVESICLYVNAMHDMIQERISSNNRNVDIIDDDDIDMQFNDNDDDIQFNDDVDVDIEFIPDCVLCKECQCVAM